VQFYLVFPLLLRLLNRYGPLSLVRIIAAAAMLRTFAWMLNPKLDLNQLTYFSLAGRIDQFLFGMLAAVAFVRYRKFLGAGLLAASGIGIVAALWMFNQLHGFAAPAGWRVVWVDLEGALWACFIASYVSVLEGRKGRIARSTAAVGERSYSIYLLHFVIVSWVASHTKIYIPIGGPVTGAMLTGLLIVVPIAIAASFVTFDAIEKPFLSLRVKYIAEVPSVSSPTAPVSANPSTGDPLVTRTITAEVYDPAAPRVPAHRG
jgi:peptidoglycan/LPS O-acetylase OafA/YrhL